MTKQRFTPEFKTEAIEVSTVAGAEEPVAVKMKSASTKMARPVLDLYNVRRRFSSPVKKFGGSVGLVILVYVLKPLPG